MITCETHAPLPLTTPEAPSSPEVLVTRCHLLQQAGDMIGDIAHGDSSTAASLERITKGHREQEGLQLLTPRQREYGDESDMQGE